MWVELAIAFTWSSLVVLFSIPSIKRIARTYNLYDTPGSRSLHKEKIPRLGGIAIYGSFISTLLTVSPAQAAGMSACDRKE